VLGQVSSRTSACVVDWLGERTPQFREAIRFVAIDTAAVYAKAIRTEGLVPNATLVVDHLPLVTLANDAVTTLRRPGDLGAQGPPRTQDRPSLGQPTQAGHRLRTPVGARLSRRCGTR
jgi:hypothetical protein